jgi:signal transduction histidine kinase
MRSLTLKLTLAFLFVSIVGVLLVAFVVWQRTGHEFDKFVLTRYQTDLIDELSAYYDRAGSWDDFNAILIGAQRRYGERAARIFAPVTLSDSDGEVIFGGVSHRAGDQLSDQELKRAVSVEVDDENVGWVLFTDPYGRIASLPETPESQFLTNFNKLVLFGAFVALVIALIIGIILARTISDPIREVTAATQKVAGGDLGIQVPVRTKDELGELASSFNKMSTDLERSNRQRRQMTADIAHDLRTPFSVILGYMESLADGKLKPSQETLEVMYAKGLHVQHLIDDLRTLTLADAGELVLNSRPVEPLALLEHVALAHRIQAQEKNVEITVEASEDLPTLMVDPDRMGQVLENLITNALRYTGPGGSVTLSASAVADRIQIDIHDTGSGISSEELPLIFDRFFRSDQSRSPNSDAGESGLGLAIAKSLVQAQGGSIAVSSVPGEGTTFTICLPTA